MKSCITPLLLAATLHATAAELRARDATPADLAQLLSQPARGVAPLPPAPAPGAVRASVAGVDANGNGVRDELELSLAQAVSYLGDTASAAEFAQLLSVVTQVQPKDTHEAGKPIDLRAFYCAYRALPSRIQALVSAEQILAMVRDTPARKRAFAQQAINTSGSLGAEVCK